MNVSVVIATRNRADSLQRLLDSLGRQTYPLHEVIVVDSSDVPRTQEELAGAHPALILQQLTSSPSVCRQRNLGIRHATGDYVFICDDDMEVPSDYISRIADHLSRHPDAGAVSGIVVEPDRDGGDRFQFPITSLGTLALKFVFQLPIWGNVDNVATGFLGMLPYAFLKRFYARRGNDISWAGWPVLTDFREPVFRTRIWGLGATIIRRSWLGDAPYDERLDQFGIGDNYDVSLQLPGRRPIAVLTDAVIYHHKIHDNRLPSTLAFFRRTLALHYFLVKHRRFTRVHRMWFCWSLIGKYWEARRSGDRDKAKAAMEILRLVLRGKNPYVLARRNGQPGPVAPVLGPRLSAPL